MGGHMLRCLISIQMPDAGLRDYFGLQTTQREHNDHIKQRRQFQENELKIFTKLYAYYNATRNSTLSVRHYR